MEPAGLSRPRPSGHSENVCFIFFLCWVSFCQTQAHNDLSSLCIFEGPRTSCLSAPLTSCLSAPPPNTLPSSWEAGGASLASGRELTGSRLSKEQNVRLAGLHAAVATGQFWRQKPGTDLAEAAARAAFSPVQSHSVAWALVLEAKSQYRSQCAWLRL